MKGKSVIPSLTHKEIQDALDYDPQTGIFVWKIRPAKNVRVGTRAGGDCNVGYRNIRLLGQEITEGRLAWFYQTGAWPTGRVKYKNGNPADCRFENLIISKGVDGEFDHKTDLGRSLYQKFYRKKETKSTKKAKHLKRHYNISLDQYNEILKDQNGVCAICYKGESRMLYGKPTDLAVDHCHRTGKVRGLLCYSCNIGIGKLREDVTILSSALRYLGI